MKREPGMVPSAWERYVHCARVARITLPDIIQTVGDAKASSGYHLADGTFTNEKMKVETYCAATDISIKHPLHLTGGEVSDLLLSLFHGDFIPFWRHGEKWDGNEHIHMIWPMVAMKPELISQVKDFCHGRDGLKGHNPEQFWSGFINQIAWKHQVERIKRMMLLSNSVTF